MKIKNGKIAECTEAELFEYWLKRYAEIMSFTDYMRHCEAYGTLVTDKDADREEVEHGQRA